MQRATGDVQLLQRFSSSLFSGVLMAPSRARHSSRACGMNLSL